VGCKREFVKLEADDNFNLFGKNLELTNRTTHGLLLKTIFLDEEISRYYEDDRCLLSAKPGQLIA